MKQLGDKSFGKLHNTRVDKLITVLSFVFDHDNQDLEYVGVSIPIPIVAILDTVPISSLGSFFDTQ